jgi:hypothetical protein
MLSDAASSDAIYRASAAARGRRTQRPEERDLAAPRRGTFFTTGAPDATVPLSAVSLFRVEIAHADDRFSSFRCGRLRTARIMMDAA